MSALWRTVAYSCYIVWTLICKRGIQRNRRIIFYFKNYLLAIPFLAIRQLLSRRIVLLFEAHVPPTHPVARFILRRVDGVVPVSNVLARELAEQYSVHPQRMLVAHQGVNLRFVEAVRLDKDAARATLGLPRDRKLAVYTGKVHANSEEIDFLLEAARRLPGDGEMVIVGGRADQVSLLRDRVTREGIRNVHLPGFVAPAEVCYYQMAADVLLTYYPSSLSLNKYRASPGKLFEYMASRRPIVTADYPALREALSPGAALFVEKDDPERLARGIEQVLRNESLARNLAEQAYADVQKFTWENRAAKVLEFVDAIAANRPTMPSAEDSSG